MVVIEGEWLDFVVVCSLVVRCLGMGKQDGFNVFCNVEGLLDVMDDVVICCVDVVMDECLYVWQVVFFLIGYFGMMKICVGGYCEYVEFM